MGCRGDAWLHCGSCGRVLYQWTGPLPAAGQTAMAKWMHHLDGAATYPGEAMIACCDGQVVMGLQETA